MSLVEKTKKSESSGHPILRENFEYELRLAADIERDANKIFAIIQTGRVAELKISNETMSY